MKNFIIWVVVVTLAAFGIYFLTQSLSGGVSTNTTTDTESEEMTEDENQMEQGNDKETLLGTSIEGNPITAYHYGNGTTTKLLFVGGIHGGYEWNTVLVARELMSYLESNPEVIPANVKVTVIPLLNPDGLVTTIGTTSSFTKADIPSSEEKVIAGRFNANNVDLNRNFDCDWQESAKWQSRTVSGGGAVFSEPESQAVRNYINNHRPTAAVVFYSAANGVFASSCHNDVLPETSTITSVYSKASGYPAYQNFDFYAVTGDMVNWLAKENIPAISVLLSTHDSPEWDKNQKGVKALLEYYAE